MSIDLRAALAPADLDDGQIDRLSALLTALEGDEHAPTAAQERDLAVYVHLADSLTALDVDAVRAARSHRRPRIGRRVSRGSALADRAPRARVTLVESQRRKCEFLERAISAADIANASVVCCPRRGAGPQGLAAHDVVTARALAPQPVVLEYAAPLLRVGGTFVDWRGARDEEEERRRVASGRGARA